MKAGEFIIKTFHIRTAAHVLHLKSTSYAQHMALGDFYEELVDLIDSYAEAYMGQYGMIDGYTGMYKNYEKPLDMLDDYAAYIEQNRGQIHEKKDTCLANIIDEILALLDQTAYKIRFLK